MFVVFCESHNPGPTYRHRKKFVVNLVYVLVFNPQFWQFIFAISDILLQEKIVTNVSSEYRFLCRGYQTLKDVPPEKI